MAEPALAYHHVRRIGRYDLHEEIASGGMATVYLGRLIGATGFSRPVAIKRLHDNLATDPQFVSMLLDEARLAARVRHPNVVATLDVVEADREVVVVMEYVHGESLASLRKLTTERGERIPPKLAATIIAGALHGLHAAHEAVDEQGDALRIVHRDVSPQNILVGVDGIPRVLDFGIAKAAGRMQTTQDGKLKGKFGYMAPEQLKGGEITRQADVYAAAVVLWEILVGRRLYAEDTDAATILTQVLFQGATPPSQLVPGLSAAADEVVMHGLAKDPEQRYATALEMAVAVERAFGLASPVDVGNYVKEIAKDAIRQKSETLAIVERADTDAGQKQRREVVARFAAGQSEAPGGDRARRRGMFAWIAGLMVIAFGGSFVAVKLITKPKSAPAPTVESTTPEPSATIRGSAVVPTPPSATPALSVDAPDASTAATASGASATPKQTVNKRPIVKRPDGKSPPTPEPPVVTPPVTPPSVEPPVEDASRDLIPKLRK